MAPGSCGSLGRHFSALCVLLRREHAFGDVVAPQVGGTEVGERHLGALVPGLAHEVGEVGSAVARRGGQARAQAVAGVALRVQAGAPSRAACTTMYADVSAPAASPNPGTSPITASSPKRRLVPGSGMELSIT